MGITLARKEIMGKGRIRKTKILKVFNRGRSSFSIRQMPGGKEVSVRGRGKIWRSLRRKRGTKSLLCLSFKEEILIKKTHRRERRILESKNFFER